MQSERTLLIDGNGIAYATLYGMREINLSDDEGFRTEIIYAFLKSILRIGKILNSGKMVFTWDSPRTKSRRRAIYPAYKADRDELSEAEKMVLKVYHEQLGVLKSEIIPGLGFANSFEFQGFEADDIMAEIARTNPGYSTIVSSDSDMLQCLSERVSIYDPHPKRLSKVTIDSFMREYGIHPKKWRMVKCLAGCDSDNVSGIPGVGVKYAIKYILGELPAHYKVYGKIKAQEEEIVKINAPLVILPFEGLPEINLQNETLKEDKFLIIFHKYQFNSFLTADKWIEWKGIFNLQ